MNELKEKAATKYGELAAEIKELKAEQVITNNLLCQLCDLKEKQQNSDNSFRDSWRNAKVRDTRVSLWVLILANIALYLDVIKVDGKSDFVIGLLKFFS